MISISDHAEEEVVKTGDQVVFDLGDPSILEAEVENWKKRAMFAESKAEALEEEQLRLQEKIGELTVQLQSSMEHQGQFMVAGDKANMTVQKMNSDTADDVVKALAPQLSAITSLDGNIGTVLAQVSTIATTLRGLPTLLTGQVETMLSNQSSELGRSFDF